MREIVPELTPWGEGLRSYKRGDDAWPPVSLQLNLNSFGNQLELDGVIGPKTEKVIRSFQSHRDLTVDGIAGGATQQRMCVDLAQPEAVRAGLPDGLIVGLMEHESSFMLAAYTPHPTSDGFDFGVFQDAFYAAVAPQAELAAALDVRAEAATFSTKLASRHAVYRAKGTGNRRAWECAALFHNRESSADRLAAGESASTNTGPVAWVEAASGGRLHTIAEWCDDYIRAVTKYVSW